MRIAKPLLRWGARALLCLAPGLAAGQAVSALDEPRFRRIGDERSIPEATVTALAEDQSGQIWIGTHAGLLRYDGYRFRRYEQQRGAADSLPGNLIRALLGASDGRVWIGTDIDGLSVFDPVSGRFRNYAHDPQRADSLSPGGIFGLAEDRHGQIWIGTRSGGLDRFDPVGERFVHYRRSDEGGRSRDPGVNTLLFDHAGDLWVGSVSGLGRLTAGSAQIEPVWSDPEDPQSLADEVIFSLQQTADGAIWIGTRDGDLARFDPRSGRGERLPPIADPAANSGSISAIIQSAPNQVWVARFTGLELRSADGQPRALYQHDPARPDSLGGNDVRELLLDRSGGLWVGGFGGGVQRFQPNQQAIRVLRKLGSGANGWVDPNISAILYSRDLDIWLGSRGDGLWRLNTSFDLLKHYQFGEGDAGGLPSPWITALAQTRDGRLWLGSRDGLHRYHPTTDRFSTLTNEPGLQATHVRRLLAGPDGQLWAGGNRGLFEISADGKTRAILAAGRPLQGDINAIELDPTGTLWVGSSVGLFRRPAGAPEFSEYRSPAGAVQLPTSIVGLLVDRSGHLWVDTTEGLFRLRLRPDGDRIEAISRALGLADLSFGANLLEDAQGRIWSPSYLLDPAHNSVHALGEGDGAEFGTNWFRAYARGPADQLLFGGSRGLMVVEPARFQPWDYAPPLVISELRVDGQPQPGTGLRLTLPPGGHRFSVEFAALDYTAPDRLRYRHRLLGESETWIDSDAGYRQASYGNLWPGDYRLQIQGSNRNGVWSPHTVDLEVKVLPALWQTPGFALAVLAAVLGLLWLTVRWRTASAARRARALQALIGQRTAELQRAKEQAEKTLEDLRGTQQQLVDAEKMASLGQLVAGVAHEINTPIGVALTAASHLCDVTRQQEAKASSGQLSRREFNDWRAAVEEGMRLVLVSLGRASDLIGSFKQVAVDQSSEKRRRFALHQFLEEVRFALQPTLRKGGHQLLIDCPDNLQLDTYPGALFQIFTNLISNSITHAYPEPRAGQLQIRASQQGEWLQIDYCDDGAGMPSETVERAFEPFFTTRRGRGGSGLGLHLVYNLTTQLLAGTIRLEGRPGQGCHFTLRIPCITPRRAEPKETP